MLAGMFDAEKAVADFVRFGSVSADPSAKAGMDGAVRFLSELLRRHCGCEVEVVPTPGHPVVIGRRGGDPAWPHVVVYGHYDVQPQDPLDEWNTPPFEPVVKNGFMYGRGTADDKGPLMVHIAAFAKLLEADPGFPVRATFLVEGEEEVGSVNLAAVMEAKKEELAGDFVLMSDTNNAGPDDATITTGLRGLACLEVILRGPKQDLHSGINGGPVMNPIRALAKLCAGLHDEKGRVTIPGFYDAVRPALDWEKAELARMGDDVEAYKKLLGVPAFVTPEGYGVFESRSFGPTLEYNGITGGYQGPGSKTIIPAKASVKISCRLVPDQKGEAILDLVDKAIRERCPQGVTMEIIHHSAGDPYVVLPPHLSGEGLDSAKARAFAAADREVRASFGNPPHYLREGGSVPILSDIRRILGMDALMLGVALPDSCMHSPNENLSLEVFRRCTKVSEAIWKAVARK
jgi:acetylornithine deacetylase/succinyl-diaminopimelate desuccinylase-like protein